MSTAMGRFVGTLLQGAQNTRQAIIQLVQSIGQSVASSIGGPFGGFLGGILGGLGGIFGGGNKTPEVNIANEPVVHLSELTGIAMGANIASAIFADRWFTSQHQQTTITVGFDEGADGVLTAKVASNLASGNEYDFAGAIA